MSKTADTHVLGSREGYRCLAKSSGLSAAELSELETLGFGQTSDQGFVQSLQHQPSAFCRILPTGRVAVSRCFSGVLDDAGRATLEIRSIVLSPDQYTALCLEGLEALVADSNTWSDAAFDAGEQLELKVHRGSNRRAIEPADLAVYDAWVVAAMKSEAFVALPDRPESHSAIFRFLQVIHPKDRLQFRWGVRLLSTGLGIHVGTIAPAGARGGRRRIIDMDPKQGPQSPAVRYLDESLRQGSLAELPPVATLHGSVGRAGVGTETDAIAAPRGDRGSRFWVAGVALLLLAGGTVGTVVFLQSGQSAQQKPESVVPSTENVEQQQSEIELYSQIEAVLTSAEGLDGARLVEILSNNRRILLGNRFEELRRQDGLAETRVSGLERRLANRFDALREELESTGSDLRVQIRSELLPLLRNWQSAGSEFATPSASELLGAVEQQPVEEPAIDEDSRPPVVQQPKSDPEISPEVPPRFLPQRPVPRESDDGESPEVPVVDPGESPSNPSPVRLSQPEQNPFERIASGFDPTSGLSTDRLSSYAESVAEALDQIKNRSDSKGQEEEKQQLLAVEQIQALCVEWWACVQNHLKDTAKLEEESRSSTLTPDRIDSLWQQLIELERSHAALLQVHKILSDDRLSYSRYFGKDDDEGSTAWQYQKDTVENAVLARLKALDSSARKPRWTPNVLSDFNKNNADHLNQRPLSQARKRLEGHFEQRQEKP